MDDKKMRLTESSEILIAGDLMEGYYGLPEATGDVLKDGWYYTGDIGYLDEENRLFIEGRIRDIIVTENGIATTDDSRRVEFIRRALAGVQSCIDDGIPVKGYCHWSLLDNFEWQKGFSMTFGLIAVDRKTQTRYPKESLAYLGSFRK